MDEIRVIARALARAGKEEQLRNRLVGMLTPTRAEQGCRLYELYESNNRGLFYITRIGKVKMHPIAIQRHRTISNWRKMFAVCSRALLKSTFWIRSVSSGNFSDESIAAKSGSESTVRRLT